MRLLVSLNLLLRSTADLCKEIKIGKNCYKEIPPINELVPCGKVINDGELFDVSDGFSPLGSGKKISCPDGTFAYRYGF